jgi:hypothetical protein
MYVFLTSIFQIDLLPYLHLIIVSMKNDILINIKSSSNINTTTKTTISNVLTKSLLICINF